MVAWLALCHHVLFYMFWCYVVVVELYPFILEN